MALSRPERRGRVSSTFHLGLIYASRNGILNHNFSYSESQASIPWHRGEGFVGERPVCHFLIRRRARISVFLAIKKPRYEMAVAKECACPSRSPFSAWLLSRDRDKTFSNVPGNVTRKCRRQDASAYCVYARFGDGQEGGGQRVAWGGMGGTVGKHARSLILRHSQEY